jgi:phage terminase large subunit
VQGDDFVPHDARVRSLETGRTRIEILIAEGRKPRLVADHKREDGINAARMTIGRTWFDRERCETAIEAMKQYRREWDDERKVFKETPLHDWCSDYADGYRYLAMAWREIVPEAPRKPDPIISIGPTNEMTMDMLWEQEKRSGRRASRI